MKKLGILNSDIARILALMGHTDTLCIADCGLPIPTETERIDISLALGMPGFLQTLEAVYKDMEIEKITLAEEIKTQNPEIENAILTIFPKVEVNYISHEVFKECTKKCKAVIRTGEITPYANIILHSGVVF